MIIPGSDQAYIEFCLGCVNNCFILFGCVNGSFPKGVGAVTYVMFGKEQIDIEIMIIWHKGGVQ